jgi:hypothetical protein
VLITLIAFVMIAIAFTAHVLIWRLARPLNSGIALTSIFAITFTVGLAFITALHPFNWRIAWTDCIRLTLLYLGLMTAYIATYPAVEADSPTLHMFDAIWKAGERGLSVQELRNTLGGDRVITPRLRDLLSERFAKLSGDKMVLTKKGKVMALIFHTYRRLTGRALGG